ncbi:hypothetical protein BGZ46_010365 [Entomortierella lignicola]|nr:hypothetical protein BGZ46_010365 [Entomortierella lignicola]
MSVVPSIPPNTMSPNDPRTDLDSTSSPPVTPPTKSSDPDTGSARPSLPSPPPSSSSRHPRPLNHNQDLILDQDRGNQADEEPFIHNISRRLSSTAIASTLPNHTSTQGKTHSSSSSMSSSTSNNQLPMTLNNKHAAVTKTKTIGHLARSTSSEVDNEVANALASGRSIVSKTDWKEEDAQYLVQLIEAQFPKGNIIWDWVGQQMTGRGFTKSQCRSKWKRIRTKVLHGSDPPNKGKDARDQRDQEQDELIDDDDDDTGEPKQESAKWAQRQEYDHPSEGPGYSDLHRSRPYEPHNSVDLRHREDYYDVRERREGHRSQASPVAPPPHSHRVSTSYHPSRQTIANDRSTMEENEVWSDDDRGGYYSHDTTSKRYSQDYQSRHSPSRQYHHRRQSSSIQMRDEPIDDSLRTLSAIAATPTSFGKIEWKPEDSDYLVYLIESKFASRKVDWAWVSKQMEGRGYDRTQCKSRWWRVQHRQNQNGQQNSSSSHHASTSQPLSRNKQHDQTPIDVDVNGVTSSKDEKNMLSDEESHQSDEKRSSGRGPAAVPESSSTNLSDNSTMQQDGPDVDHRHQQNNIKGDEDSQMAASEERGDSPRLTRAHEHQKHIEWKEEDSQYMYRLIEKEFPVGNVVWSVIGEKMQSRGYSQTQCMSKWRRHLKNNKAPNDASKTSMSMDLDDIESVSNDLRPTGYRRRGPEDRPFYNDLYSEGAKRFRRDGLDSRRYEKNLDYRTVDPLDARLVEMEYDRYYDAGGKRRRADDEDSQPPSEPGYPYRRRSRTPPYGDYHEYDRDSGRRLPRNIDSVSPRYRSDYNQDGKASAQDANGSSQPSSSAVYNGDRNAPVVILDAEHERNHGDEGKQETQPRSRRGSDISNKYYGQQSSSAADPRQWPDEKREGPNAEYSDSYPRHRHRSSSVSSYREYYSSNPSYSRNHASNDSISHGHSYSREELSQDAIHRKNRELIRRTSPGGEREVRRGEAMDHDHSQEDISNRGNYRGSRSSYDYDNDHGRHHQSRHNGRYPPRSRQEYDRGESDFIDYALEDEMEWAAGRWESRDMARLAAAVARQGRRWDAIRAQIKIPTLVSPNDDVDNDIYDGLRFDPYPSTHHYHSEESRRSRHHHQRPYSYSASHDIRDSHRYSSSPATRYGTTSREPISSSSSRLSHASSKKIQRSEQPTLQTPPTIEEPTEVNQPMEILEDDVVVNADHSTWKSPRHDRAGEDTVVEVISVEDNIDQTTISGPHEEEKVVEMKEVTEQTSQNQEEDQIIEDEDDNNTKSRVVEEEETEETTLSV